MKLNLPKLKRSESTFNSEQRLTILEQSNQVLSKKVLKLERENKDLKATLENIQQEINHPSSHHSNSIKAVNNNEDQLVEFITQLDKDKMLTRTVQEELQRSVPNEEGETKAQKEIHMKVFQLEQADVYLQETTKQVMEKLTSLETMLKISSHDHDETRSGMLMLKDSLQSMNTNKEKLIQNKSDLHNGELFAKSDKHLNNQQTPLQQDKKFQMSLQDISTTNFSDTKSVVSISSLTSSIKKLHFRSTLQMKL